LNTEETRGWI